MLLCHICLRRKGIGFRGVLGCVKKGGSSLRFGGRLAGALCCCGWRAMEAAFLKGDARTIWSNILYEEKLLNTKRRWLMGLCRSSKSKKFSSCSTPKKFRNSKFKIPELLKDVSLQESFLRDDDVSYEALRACVQRSFAELFGKQEGHYILQDYLQGQFDMIEGNRDIASLSNLLRTIFSVLDDLNNNGLCCLAIIVSRNSMEFVKTRPRMKEFIRRYLPYVLRESNHKYWKDELMNLFMDSSNFRENRLSFTPPVQMEFATVSECLVSAAGKVIERLDDMCKLTLQAMHRKLKGTMIVPQIEIYPCTNSKKRLCKQVQKTCYRILSEQNEGDKLPMRLTKAMAVAVLSLKTQGRLVDCALPNFYHFPPEIEALQNQVLKAIQTVRKLHYRKLKHLQPILDPKAKIPMPVFRRATERLLVESLYECGDIDIPDSLLRAITFINMKSEVKKEAVEEEIECVLDLSSQLRQIIWEMLPDHDIDCDFADAYMDDMRSENVNIDIELDDDGNCSIFDYHRMPTCGDGRFGQLDGLQVDAPCSDDESVGDSRAAASIQLASTRSGSCCKASTIFNTRSTEEPESEQNLRMYLSDQHGVASISHLDLMSSSPHKAQTRYENQYLAKQEICDETSLVGHRLIGRLIEEFLLVEGADLNLHMRSYLRGGASFPADLQDAEGKESTTREGGSILIQAVEDLVPSFPKNGIEKVKELLGL